MNCYNNHNALGGSYKCGKYYQNLNIIFELLWIIPFSYVFMVEERIESLVCTRVNADAPVPDSARSYPVTDQQDMTKFSKLFYQTGRLQGADKYIWISPFIRYILYASYYISLIPNFLGG